MTKDLTNEQREAVGTKGEIIVSASAGSGKTFVMIERLVERIVAGTDIRKILAVTFTNRAAAQIKDRLRSALLKRMRDADGETRARLKTQLSALPMAEISTIHAFCARIVRSYFYLPGLDPAFKIISEDSADGSILFSRAIDEVFETAYFEKSEDLYKLLEVYFYKKKDEKLKKIIRNLYREVRKIVCYRDFLEKTGQDDLFDRLTGEIYDDFCARIELLKERVEDLRDCIDGGDKLQNVLSGQEAALFSLKGSGLFALRDAAGTDPVIPRMPPSSKYEGEALEDYYAVKALTEAVKQIYKEVGGLSDEEEERRRYAEARDISRALAAMTLRFDEVLTRMKRENGVLDYNDLEQYAFEILQNADARAAISGKYDEIFVDEYQDVNGAQESILNLVGKGEVFLVGDAKQAIYAFRGSRSEFFIKRMGDCKHALHITENFRSAPAILEAVNRVFSYSMTKKTAGFDYILEPMRGGSRYGGHEGGVHFYHIPRSEKKPPEERGIYDIRSPREKEYDAQAEFIADLVLDEHGSEWYDADMKTTRELRYSDIAILVRSNTGEADRIISALSDRNIPVTSSAKVNVCDFWEARLLIDFLSYLDDPEQDIPLAGALLSRIGGLTESELSKVRDAFPAAKNFRTACRLYALREDTVALKLNTFFKRTEKYRAFLEVKTCSEIAELLLSDGLEAEICAKRDGMLRKSRITRLIGEMQGNVGEFLRRLKAIGYVVNYSENGAEDAVKVMTIHASKGLEFPVVILVDMNKSFHGSERDEVLFTEKYSIAPKSYDGEKKLISDNLLRRATTLQLDREERRGELNLFYVAMTRAKYRLHAIFRDIQQGDPVYAGKFSDFVNFETCGDYFAEREVLHEKQIERSELIYRPDEKVVDEIRRVYRKEYAHAESVLLPMKSSATRILEEERESEEGNRGNLKGSTVEEGLAYHAFLQNVDFERRAGEELARMERDKILPPEQLAILKTDNLEKIMALPAIEAMKGKRVLREQRFLAMIPACELYPTECTDEILVQGAIDALYLSENGYMIVDYKYSSRGGEELKKAYAPQISVYRSALSRALHIGRETIGARIVNIRRGEEVEM